MADKTGIEWTDATWNPLVGCEHVSPGCDNCYAARETAGRLSGHPAYAGLAVRGADGVPKFTGEVRQLPDRLDQPARWSKPRRIFVNSMSDLFHRDVPDDFILRVFQVMDDHPRHVFQVLTKRPQRMAALLGSESFQQAVNGDARPSPNVWLGTSIESDRYTFRADHLRATPAAVRWISAEPLLGPLDSLDLDGIDWLVVGGESGPGARPMHPDDVRDLRDRAGAAGVAFLFKQWGEWLPDDQPLPEEGPQHCEVNSLDGIDVWRLGKRYTGRVLDGRTWDEYPAVRPIDLDLRGAVTP